MKPVYCDIDRAQRYNERYHCSPHQYNQGHHGPHRRHENLCPRGGIGQLYASCRQPGPGQGQHVGRGARTGNGAGHAAAAPHDEKSADDPGRPGVLRAQPRHAGRTRRAAKHVSAGRCGAVGAPARGHADRHRAQLRHPCPVRVPGCASALAAGFVEHGPAGRRGAGRIRLHFARRLAGRFVAGGATARRFPDGQLCQPGVPRALRHARHTGGFIPPPAGRLRAGAGRARRTVRVPGRRDAAQHRGAGGAGGEQQRRVPGRLPGGSGHRPGAAVRHHAHLLADGQPGRRAARLCGGADAGDFAVPEPAPLEQAGHAGFMDWLAETLAPHLA